MKQLLTLLCCMLLAFAIFAGCSSEQEGTEQGAAGQPEEMQDTTRMEAAPDTMMQDTMMEDTMMMQDSM